MLPVDLQPRFKEMPAKIAYILASKRAPMESKVAIVKDYGQGTLGDPLLLIQEALNEGKSPSIGISPIEKILLHLEKESVRVLLCKGKSTETQQQRIRVVVDQLQSVIE